MQFTAIPTDHADALRQGGLDANGQRPERHISDGQGNPCRHCLKEIPAGAEMLILAYRPFPEPQPYAETGPIFLCADACPRYPETPDLPPSLTSSPDYLVKGYSSENRIVYGTGQITETSHLTDRITQLFSDPRVDYVHIRSARNNCFQARADRL